jgi:septin family protein
MEHIETFIFRHPFTCMIVGPSQSGKTSLIKNILFENKELINEPPDKIYYCYSEWQPAFEELKNSCNNIEFIKGIIETDEIDSTLKNLVILDDLMEECGKDKTVDNLFTKDSHHKNISVFFISQNLFSKDKNCRTISINSRYLVLMNNPRDKLQIEVLARQMFPNNSKYLIEAYEDAVRSSEYGYLVLDFHHKTDSKLRVLSGILHKETRIYYVPK